MATHSFTPTRFHNAIGTAEPALAIADGDTVITQWRMTGTHQKALMNIQPTGKQCTVDGISIGRFRSGRLVEDWLQWDALGLMRQFGVAPPVQTGAGATQPGVQPHA